MRRILSTLIALALGAALAWLAPPAVAADTGLLRVAHLSPDSPAVDVTVEGSGVTFAGVGYGDVTDYQALPAGTYTVDVRGAGADPSRPPALTTTVSVQPGTAQTVAGVGTFAQLALSVFQDDLSAPTAGTARVRVLAGASGAPSLDVGIPGSPPLASSLPFGQAGGYVDVPAGDVQVQLSPPGGDLTTVPVQLQAGGVYSLVVLDQDGGGLTARAVRDATGPATTPVGGVAAGVVGGSALPSVGLPAAAGLQVAGRVAPLAGPLTALASTLAADAGRPVPPPEARPAPVRLQIPAIGVDAPLEGLLPELGGALTAPADPTQAGWLATGPAPGDVGPAVVTGHVTYRGPAVFARLAELAPGDEVQVVRADGTTAAFVVTAVGSYPKAAFPTAAVYGPTPDAQLRLVTCGGDLDATAHSYADNVVVFAAPA
jgi:sortase (surface protein transpeptidase)